MTPREALYHLSMALGPVPITTRDDNLSYQESVIQDAMNTLHTWVDAEVLPSGDLFEIQEPDTDTIAEDMVASGVKIWDWGTGEITDESGNVYTIDSVVNINAPSSANGEVRADGFSTDETAEEMDGTAVSHGETTDCWDGKTTLLGDASYTEELIEDITEWHYDRNLIDGSTDKDQFCKLIQECGELSDNLCKGADIRDDIGDIMVVLINIAERNALTISECLNVAYEDIKDRKGRMVDGVFVKED